MQKLKYNKFGSKYILHNIPFVIILAILFFIAWFNWEKNDFIFFASIILFTVGAITRPIWDKKGLKNIHCPKCNNLISEPTITMRKENDPINYFCSQCDIEWETGLVEPSG
jgi:hypothetical protein